MNNLLPAELHLNKRKVLLTLLFFIPSFIYSQDLIILRNGEQINCKITKIDSTVVYYDFQKGERILSSFIDKGEIRCYQINVANRNQNDINGMFTSEQRNTVFIPVTYAQMKPSNK